MESHKKLIIGIFQDEVDLMSAATCLKKNKISIFDMYTPFPVHGLDEILDLKRSRLPIITFFAALLGCVLAFYFQIWTSKVSWPINVGGKPFNSFVAFIPVGFEITILFGALITVAFFFFRTGLFPWKKEEILDPGVTNYHFVLAVEYANSSLDLEYVEKIMIDNGANEVKQSV